MDIKYFTDLKDGFNAFELKMEYKNLAVKNHPDKGGNVKTFQSIFAEYQFLSQNIGCATSSIMIDSEFIEDFDSFCASIDLELFEAYNKIKGLKDLFKFNIEICGIYMYITDIEDFKKNKDNFKNLGFYYQKTKNAWVFKPSWYKCRSRKNTSMSKIRATHNSYSDGSKKREKIAA